jgi:hypothetical protein
MYPPAAEADFATPALERLMISFFNAKSGQDPDGTMAFFSRPDLVYSDAAYMRSMDWDQIHGIYAEYMPNWGEGKTYPTRILGDEHSAVVFMTCTPELFGQEILAIIAADMRDGKIVRWVDYWDGRHYGVEAMRALEATIPREADEPALSSFGEERLEPAASPRMTEVVEALSGSLSSGDAAGAAAAFAPECIFEDMTLRSQIRGRLALERYFERALEDLPYGTGSQVRHVLGADRGGGFEWRQGPEECGITALELDADGAITRMTSVWNAAKMDDADLASLVAKSVEPSATVAS